MEFHHLFSGYIIWVGFSYGISSNFLWGFLMGFCITSCGVSLGYLKAIVNYNKTINLLIYKDYFLNLR